MRSGCFSSSACVGGSAVGTEVYATSCLNKRQLVDWLLCRLGGGCALWRITSSQQHQLNCWSCHLQVKLFISNSSFGGQYLLTQQQHASLCIGSTGMLRI
jgi:hypothetical protein